MVPEYDGTNKREISQALDAEVDLETDLLFGKCVGSAKNMRYSPLTGKWECFCRVCNPPDDEWSVIMSDKLTFMEKMAELQVIRRVSGLMCHRLSRKPSANGSPALTGFTPTVLASLSGSAVVDAVANFNRREQPEWRPIAYTFDGIERRETMRDYVVTFRRNGLLTARLELPLNGDVAHPDQQSFIVTAIDVMLRRFVLKARRVYEAARIGAPFVSGRRLSSGLYFRGGS